MHATANVFRQSVPLLSLTGRNCACLKTLRALILAALMAALGAVPHAAGPLDVEAQANSDYPSLFELYRHLHANPELSFQESKTSARLQEELGKAGFQVTGNVGGYGFVGVLRNGAGPTVMIRTDLDALPVTEK